MSAIMIVLCSLGAANAQLEKGSVMLGGSVGDLRVDLGSGSNIRVRLTPRVGYFIQDNLAIGAKVDLGFSGQRGGDPTYSYKLNGFGRYYFGKKEFKTGFKDGRWFAEAGVGVSGVKGAPVGLNINFGPGYAIFLNEHIALEALALYNGQIGDGNTNGLSLNVGFQIYLPSSKLKSMKK